MNHDFGKTSVHDIKNIDYLHHGRPARGGWRPVIAVFFKAHSYLVTYFHQPSFKEQKFKM